MAKMDEFLLEYYRRLHFRSMPIEQFVQFCSYVDAKDYNGNMKEWAETLLEKDPTTGEYIKNGKLYVAKSLPDPEEVGGEYELNDEEWKKLFKAFQNTFRTMDANKNSFKHNDKANKFLERYFGDTTKLFSHPTASPEAEAQIQLLINLLNDNPGIEQRLQGYWNDDFSWKDLKDGLASKKYNTDPKFLKNLQRVTGQIASDLMYDMDFRNNLRNVPSNLDLYAINDPDRFETAGINASKLDGFKMQYSELLREIYKNSKVQEVFVANDNSKISKKLTEAKSRIQYEDKQSDDYVPPKREDELSLQERVSEWWDTTYSEYLEKYVKLRGDRLYFSPHAKNIVAAIDKIKPKISPTEGLEKIVKQAGDIKDKIKSPTARKHFDWFTKTMGALSSTMPKAFAGALRNGRQMRALIEEMIMIAVRDDKVDEAKTAMEVMSVVKYGYTTSKIMDTLNKTDLTIFSDGKLSWNKNEGMKFVTTALDKSIKTAFMGIGYGITMVGNAINLSGSKFNGRRGRMMDKQQEWATQNAADKAAAQTRRNTLNTQDQALIQQENQNKSDVNQNLQPGQRTITDANFQQQKTDLETARTAEDAEKTRLEQRAQDPAYMASAQRVNDYNNLLQEQTSYQQNQPVLTQQIADLDNQIQAIQTDPNMSQTEKDMRSQGLIQTKIEKQNQLAQINQRLADIPNELNAIRTNPNWRNDQNIVQQHQAETQAYNNTVDQNNAQEDRIKKWENATKSIEEINERISKRDEVMDKWDDNHKDKYLELMAYWDMLETGRNTHMGKMYNWKPIKAGNAQKKFDGQKQTIISDYLSGYSYAA